MVLHLCRPLRWPLRQVTGPAVHRSPREPVPYSSRNARHLRPVAMKVSSSPVRVSFQTGWNVSGPLARPWSSPIHQAPCLLPLSVPRLFRYAGLRTRHLALVA